MMNQLMKWLGVTGDLDPRTGYTYYICHGDACEGYGVELECIDDGVCNRTGNCC